MPFDDTSPRGPAFGPDPAPTWGERLMAWTELAVMVAANAAILLLIALLGTLGVVLGAGGTPTGAVDCAGMALLVALVTHPFHLSWAIAQRSVPKGGNAEGRSRGARALAAGRWP